MSAKSTCTGDENHDGNEERNAEKVIEVVVNEAAVSERLDKKSVDPVKPKSRNEDRVAQVAVTHR